MRTLLLALMRLTRPILAILLLAAPALAEVHLRHVSVEATATADATGGPYENQEGDWYLDGGVWTLYMQPQWNGNSGTNAVLIGDATRATFRHGWLQESSEDRYSGLPGTRNLLWLDHLAGRRPVAFIGTKDESHALRYQLTPVGMVRFASPRGAPPSLHEQAGRALAALEQVAPEVYFRDYDPRSFEADERWRFTALVGRAAWVISHPEAADAIAAHSAGHARLLDFARRFETLDPTPDPVCLRAIGFLRLLDPAFLDPTRARRDFERYRVAGGEAMNDAEMDRALAGLPMVSKSRRPPP